MMARLSLRPLDGSITQEVAFAFHAFGGKLVQPREKQGQRESENQHQQNESGHPVRKVQDRPPLTQHTGGPNLVIRGARANYDSRGVGGSFVQVFAAPVVQRSGNSIWLCRPLPCLRLDCATRRQFQPETEA